MCGSVEETLINTNMDLMGVIQSKTPFEKRHMWKLLEE